MDLWIWIAVTLGLISWITLVGALIYWLNRARRAEAEREEFRDELRGVASLLLQYRNSYSGVAKQALNEIAHRLSITSPRFSEFFRPQNR